MAKKEANFDLFIHDLLVEAGIQADTQGSNVLEINNALKTASKHQTGKVGFPEYVAVVRDFVLVMEDKADRANLCLMGDGQILQTITATTDYAINNRRSDCFCNPRKRPRGQYYTLLSEQRACTG